MLQGPSRPAVKRKRRRGKMLRATACIDDDVDSKTFGRCCAGIILSLASALMCNRSWICNADVQFLDLFPVAKNDEHAGCDLLQPKWLRFLGVRRLTRIGQQYAAILAHMFRAMHNCDHYITKYVAKPLQSMKPVIEQRMPCSDWRQMCRCRKRTRGKLACLLWNCRPPRRKQC